MSRPVAITLACLGIFLVLFPLTLGKPGLPPNLKADESAYYLMALSLAHDQDLRLEVEDVNRVFLEYPFRPVANLIVMTDDGYRTVYYGKPYLYSLFAAPWVYLFGANGMLSFNMLLTLAMVVMGTVYLSRFNPPWVAALFASGFFFLSAGFAYVFWIQPEVFNMASVTAAFFFALHGRAHPREPRGGAWIALAALSGLCLSLAVYNKPMFAALGLPLFGSYLYPRRWPAAGAWVAGAGAGLLLWAGIAYGFTGEATSYLGVTRKGVEICEPGKLPVEPIAQDRNAAPAKGAEAVPESTPGVPGTSKEVSEETSEETAAEPSRSWAFLFRIPEVRILELLENVRYFLWGRHTGLLLYQPFVGLSLVLFLLALLRGRRRRDLSKGWALTGMLTLTALGGTALYFLIWIFFNWHGGGGFVGNRYFVNVVPAFLFLVREIRPRWLLVAFFGLGGLLVGPILFTPFGAGGPEPTLQSHVRNAPFRHFPLELSLRNVPGYHTVRVGDLRFRGRRDVVLPRGESLWIRAGGEAEVLLISPTPIDRAAFRVQTLAPANRIELDFGAAQETLDLGGAGEGRTVLLEPRGPSRMHRIFGNTYFVYRLGVRSADGRVRPWTREYPPSDCAYFAENRFFEENFFVGAVLTYLGDGDHLEDDIYRLQWGETLVPERMLAGEQVDFPVTVFNRSLKPWVTEGPARVRLSYRWRTLGGELLPWNALRTEIPGPVAPDGRVRARLRVESPPEPGRYLLEIDPVFEHVSWFGQRTDDQVYRAQVEVVAAGAEELADVR